MTTQIGSHAVKQSDLLKFMLAGKAIFTARGREHRFTFKVKQPKFNGVLSENMRMVYVLTGPDNTKDYEFVGSISRKSGGWEYKHSYKSRISESAISVAAFKYILRKLVAYAMLTDSMRQHIGHTLMPDVEVWHEGRCGCCGRLLTVPESIETGLGPECAKKF